jgi:hypothetical protein
MHHQLPMYHTQQHRPLSGPDWMLVIVLLPVAAKSPLEPIAASGRASAMPSKMPLRFFMTLSGCVSRRLRAAMEE